MRILRLYTVVLLAGLGTAVVCLAGPPQSPPLAPIVIGGDKPEAREISSCKTDFGSDALAVWITGTVRSLCKKGDADSLLAVFLITAPPFGSHGRPDWATLDSAYAIGKTNPLVLWTVALTSKCHMPFQASECERMMTAARLLTRADPDNSMAWLTLGYATDQSLADPAEIGMALDHALAAPHVHDYGFDLTKRAVIASGQVPIPEAVLGRATSEQFRSQFTYPMGAPASTITGWLKQGCNATGAIPPPASRRCAKAKELLRRGDSLETLSGNRESVAEMKADTAAATAAHSNDPAAYAKAYAKARIDAALESRNEREYLRDIKNRLEGQ